MEHLDHGLIETKILKGEAAPIFSKGYEALKMTRLSFLNDYNHWKGQAGHDQRKPPTLSSNLSFKRKSNHVEASIKPHVLSHVLSKVWLDAYHFQHHFEAFRSGAEDSWLAAVPGLGASSLTPNQDDGTPETCPERFRTSKSASCLYTPPGKKCKICSVVIDSL